MKCISLYQPYATLVALGLKKNETRSWPTDHRGRLGIHATKTEPKWCRELCEKEEPFQRFLRDYNLTFKDLPRGAIVGNVNVVGMMPTENWEAKYADDLLKPTPDEWWFGDYSRGRWAWLTEAPLHFQHPIPAKGSQGFWFYNPPDFPKRPTIENPAVYGQQLQLF